MPQCPLCQREIDDAARAAGKCPACGAILRQLPQRTIADFRVVSPDDPAGLPREPIVTIGDSTVPGRPGEETIQFDAAAETADFAPPGIEPGNDPGIESTIDFGPASAATIEIGAHDSGPTIEITTHDSGPSAAEPQDGPDLGEITLDFAGEQTVDLTAKPSGGDVDFTLLSSQWDTIHEGKDRDPNATIKQKETIGGSFATSSSLIVKSRHVRQSGGGAPTVIGSPADAPDYELLNIIGEGGMGVVYAARQSSIARTVALKMLKGEDASAVQREKFISEAVVTGELDHPNIVPIYDLGANDEGALFYSMKRVKGTPWNKVIKKKSLDENLDILLRTADAVAFAHVNGVVHRDLKPENTMLGDFGEVLVMDWGLARVSPEFPNAASVSQSDAMGGTPAYMAPEMATGPIERITPASDIYLLGAMLYEIVSGRPPHSGDTVMACLFNAAKNKITPIDENKARQYKELLEVARKAMATVPEDRYANVQDFQEAVRLYQAHSESIRLTTTAEDNLAQAAEKKDYDLYARALYALEEALALWPENTRARDTLSAARLEYARLALAKGDFDLGASILDPSNYDHQALLAQLAEGRSERESRKRRIKLLLNAVMGLVAAVVVIVTVAYFSVSRQRDRAVKAEGEAVDQRNLAVAAKEEAVQQKERAVTAEGEAVENFKQAEVARKEAVTQRDRATSEFQRAEKERKEADLQRERAVAARNAEEAAAYVARIGLAKTKIDENAFDRAAELLTRCKEQLRHWEWGRLRRLCELAANTWSASAPVDMAAVAPDGIHFASGDWDGNLIIWNREQGKPEVTVPFGGNVHAVAYDGPGNRLAVGTSDGKVRILNAADGKVLSTLEGHTEPVLRVTFSPDGKQLASGGYDNTVCLWDLATGKTRQILEGHSWWVWGIAFSPDGRRLVTAGQDAKAIVWQRFGDDDDFVRMTEFTHHRGPIYAAKFSPDGSRVATAGDDGRVLVWNPDVVAPVDIERRLDGLPDPKEKFIELLGHRGPVRSVDFASGGDMLASGGEDNTVILWDLAERKAVKQFRGHASYVRSVDFAPDGTWLLSASRDNTIKLWEPNKYNEELALDTDDGVEPVDAVLSARWSPDGKEIVTASRNHTASLWSPRTGKREKYFQEGHEFLASTAAFFAGGARLATAAGDGTARLWDVATGAETQRLDDTGRTAALAVAEDGSCVATGGAEGAIQIWDPSTGKRIAQLDGHEVEVTALRFSPDDNLLASGDDRGIIRLWKPSLDRREWTADHVLRGHSRTITAIEFAGDGQRLVTSSGDNSCGQWDVATGKELTDKVLRHPNWVADMVVSRDGTVAFTACDDGKLRIWSLDDARELRTLPAPDDNIAFTSIDLSPDGRYAAATRAADATIHIWNVATGEELPAPGQPKGPWLDLAGSGNQLWAARFAPGGDKLLAIGGNDAKLLDLATGKLIARFSPHGAVASADVSPDGSRVVTGSWDKSAKVWDAKTGHVVFKLDGLHQGYVNSVCFSPDGAKILTASDDGTARLWDAKDGHPLKPIITIEKSRIRQAAFSPDGGRILTVGGDKTARMFDAASGEEQLVMKGHEWGLFAGAFSADGRLVITGSEDNTAIIWDAFTGKELQKLSGHTAAVSSVALSPDGARALTGSQDSAVKLWDSADGEELLTLAGHAEPVTSVSFSPNGLDVLTSGRDGRVLVWPAVEWTPKPAAQARR